MLVSQINPEGVELFCSANNSFSFMNKCSSRSCKCIRFAGLLSEVHMVIRIAHIFGTVHFLRGGGGGAGAIF